MLLEVSLVSVEHAVEPREELVGAVVGVKDDGAGGISNHFSNIYPIARAA